MTKFETQVPEGQQIVSIVINDGVMYVATTTQVFTLNNNTDCLEPIEFKVEEQK